MVRRAYRGYTSNNWRRTSLYSTLNPYNSYRYSRPKLAQAIRQLRIRMAGIPRAPLSTRGFYRYRYGGSNAELKYFDTVGKDLTPSSSGGTALINGIVQGADINMRIGRKINLKSVYMAINVFNVASTQASSPQGVMIRFTLVYDSQPNSAAATAAYTDIFTEAYPLAPVNLNNRDRFRILKEMRFAVGPYTIDGNNPPKFQAGAAQNSFAVKYVKVNLPVIFSGTTATIGSISTGALLIAIAADLAPNVQYDIFTRVRYTDA